MESSEEATFQNALIVRDRGRGKIKPEIERHTGRPTLAAINRRLALERRNGFRVSFAVLKLLPGNAEDEAYMEINRYGDVLSVGMIPANRIS